MGIHKITIENFKGFEGKFSLELNPGMNILVGDNETGKTTILQAIHLALTGYYEGQNIRRVLSPYLFNQKVVQNYIDGVNSKKIPMPEPPKIIIDVYFDSIDSTFEGNGNLANEDQTKGVQLRIAFDEKYKKEYEDFLKGEINSLPIEYYSVTWTTFARAQITTYSIPVKSVLIDSSTYQYQNGSDVFVARIVRNLLDSGDVAELRKAHRKLIDGFSQEDIIDQINEKIGQQIASVSQRVELRGNQGNLDSWQDNVTTQISGIPFAYVGKGTQCILKTELALGHPKTEKATVILLEEPESHLSYSNLNILTNAITRKYSGKQIIVSTHSSFVANKLGLEHLILLKNHKTIKINELKAAPYFQALAGYDTLRFILCKKAILVEGASDELVVQRAYMDNHDGRIPIEDGVDVISVNGLAFLRYLEIAEKLNIITAVVSDNDGDIEAVRKKYQNYIEGNKKDNIQICIDQVVDKKPAEIDGKTFNCNTLEPKLLKANGLEILNKVLGKKYEDETKLLKHMHSEKTACALKIFNSSEKIKYPEYILKAIKI